MSSWPHRPPAAPRGEGATAAADVPAPDRRARSRGQSLVEFALVLPLLFVLLLIGIDFGRIYLGYINVQNMARIAANEAATTPTAWVEGDTEVIASYRRQVLEDARMINCALPMSGGTLADSADPDFSGTSLGDTVTVNITCDFSVITPFISDIVGGTVTVAGSATFPIRTGMVAQGTDTAGGIDEPAPDFMADDTSVTDGTPVRFRYTGGGGTPTSFLWDFGDGSTSVEQDPYHLYAAPGLYDVKVLATNAAGSADMLKTAYIFVAPASTIAFSATPVAGSRPLAVTFADESTGAKSWKWEFGNGQTSTEQHPTVTYNSTGTYTVKLTITDADGKSSDLTKSDYITVSAGLCKVPDFTGVSTDAAPGIWAGAGFTTQVQYQGGSRPWPIKSQTLVGNSQVPCDSTITLRKF